MEEFEDADLDEFIKLEKDANSSLETVMGFVDRLNGGFKSPSVRRLAESIKIFDSKVSKDQNSKTPQPTNKVPFVVNQDLMYYQGTISSNNDFIEDHKNNEDVFDKYTNENTSNNAGSSTIDLDEKEIETIHSVINAPNTDIKQLPISDNDKKIIIEDVSTDILTPHIIDKKASGVVQNYFNDLDLQGSNNTEDEIKKSIEKKEEKEGEMSSCFNETKDKNLKLDELIVNSKDIEKDNIISPISQKTAIHIPQIKEVRKEIESKKEENKSDEISDEYYNYKYDHHFINKNEGKTNQKNNTNQSTNYYEEVNNDIQETDNFYSDLYHQSFSNRPKSVTFSNRNSVVSFNANENILSSKDIKADHFIANQNTLPQINDNGIGEKYMYTSNRNYVSTSVINDTIEKQVTEQKKIFEQEISNIKTKYDIEIAKLKQENLQIREENSESMRNMEKEITRYTKLRNEIEKERLTNLKEHADMMADLDKERAEFNSWKRIEKSRLESDKKNLIARQGDEKEKAKKLKELQNEIDILKQEVSSLKQTIERNKTSHKIITDQLKSKNDSLIAENEELHQSLERQDRLILELRKQTRELTEEVKLASSTSLLLARKKAASEISTSNTSTTAPNNNTDDIRYIQNNQYSPENNKKIINSQSFSQNKRIASVMLNEEENEINNENNKNQQMENLTHQEDIIYINNNGEKNNNKNNLISSYESGNGNSYIANSTTPAAINKSMIQNMYNIKNSYTDNNSSDIDLQKKSKSQNYLNTVTTEEEEPFKSYEELLESFKKNSEKYISNSTVIDNKVTDSKVILSLNTGARTVKFSNGTTKSIYPNKETDIKFENNDLKKILPDGRIIYFYSQHNTLYTQLPEKQIKIYRFSNTQVEKHYANGEKEIFYSDATYKLIH